MEGFCSYLFPWANYPSLAILIPSPLSLGDLNFHTFKFGIEKNSLFEFSFLDEGGAKQLE